MIVTLQTEQVQTLEPVRKGVHGTEPVTFTQYETKLEIALRVGKGIIRGIVY